MSFSLHIPGSVTSRYSLLNAMIEELAAAFVQEGYPINPETPAQQALHLFFNFAHEPRKFLAWAQPSKPGRSLIQFFVDHPFVLDERLMDEFVRVPSFRLVMPCADETCLLPLRFPSLKTIRVAHGIPRSALCDAASLEASHATRDIGVFVAGSIQTDEELAERSSGVPAPLRSAVDDMVALMLEHPWMSFIQACDITAPGVATADQWRLIRILWRATVDRVNTKRRIRTVEALQGLDTTVYGPSIWTKHCTGTIKYAGELAYADVPHAMAKAKVCIAWGPTQFTHSYSERQLLSMAAGCATLSDDRLLARQELGDACAFYNPANPSSLRALAERYLSDTAARVSLATIGRNQAEAKHLWNHRVPALIEIAKAASTASPLARAA